MGEEIHTNPQGNATKSCLCVRTDDGGKKRPHSDRIPRRVEFQVAITSRVFERCHDDKSISWYSVSGRVDFIGNHFGPKFF